MIAKARRHKFTKRVHSAPITACCCLLRTRISRPASAGELQLALASGWGMCDAAYLPIQQRLPSLRSGVMAMAAASIVTLCPKTWPKSMWNTRPSFRIKTVATTQHARAMREITRFVHRGCVVSTTHCCHNGDHECPAQTRPYTCSTFKQGDGQQL